MRFKRNIASMFVVLMNHYLLAFLLGIILVFSILIVGYLNVWVPVFTTVSSLFVCIIFLLKRRSFKYVSIGEIVIGSAKESSILDQEMRFSVTRIPLFILLMFILILNGNLFVGLADGGRYAFSDVLTYLIIFLTIYNGIKNFFIKADILSIMVFAGGLLFTAVAFRKQSIDGLPLYETYFALTIIWLLAAFYYRSKFIGTQISY